MNKSNVIVVKKLHSYTPVSSYFRRTVAYYIYDIILGIETSSNILTLNKRLTGETRDFAVCILYYFIRHFLESKAPLSRH